MVWGGEGVGVWPWEFCFAPAFSVGACIVGGVNIQSEYSKRYQMSVISIGCVLRPPHGYKVWRVNEPHGLEYVQGL